MVTPLQLLSLITLFVITINCQSNTKLTCPNISCIEQIDVDKDEHNVCFKSDTSIPIKNFYVYQCDQFQIVEQDLSGEVMCDFDLRQNAFVWVNESIFNVTTSTQITDSPFPNKRSQGYCREVVAATLQNLNNGRTCTQGSQCKSKNCFNGICKGLDQNDNCNSHVDCDASQYCTESADVSKCSKLKTSYEACSETEECSIAHYCWFANLQDRRDSMRKQCLPLYSQDDGTLFGWYSANWLHPTYQDYEINGKYCKSGLAFPINEYQANCTSANRIEFKNQEIQYPYQCDPTDNTIGCRLWFNTTDGQIGSGGITGFDYIEVPCGCSLNGEKGFCSSLIGTPTYQTAMSTLKALLEQSDCHTLDRYNFRAQKDKCGTGPNDMWKAAVERQFQMKYWPYTQTESVNTCVKSLFQDSYDNLMKSNATIFTISAFAFILSFLLCQ